MSDLLTTARINCSLAFETFCREARRFRHEAGQTAAEYMGVLLVVSVIIAAVAKTEIGDTIAEQVRHARRQHRRRRERHGRGEGEQAKECKKDPDEGLLIDTGPPLAAIEDPPGDRRVLRASGTFGPPPDGSCDSGRPTGPGVAFAPRCPS